MGLVPAHPLTPTHLPTHPPMHSHPHTHSYTYPHSHLHKHWCTPNHALPQHLCTPTHIHTQPCTQPPTHPHTPTHAHTHTHVLTPTPTDAHSLPALHSHLPARSPGAQRLCTACSLLNAVQGPCYRRSCVRVDSREPYPIRFGHQVSLLVLCAEGQRCSQGTAPALSLSCSRESPGLLSRCAGTGHHLLYLGRDTSQEGGSCFPHTTLCPGPGTWVCCAPSPTMHLPGFQPAPVLQACCRPHMAG